MTKEKLSFIQILEEEVYPALANLEEDKAIGPDNISPRILRRCACQLARPLSTINNICLHGRKTGIYFTMLQYMRKKIKQT